MRRVLTMIALLAAASEAGILAEKGSRGHRHCHIADGHIFCHTHDTITIVISKMKEVANNIIHRKD